MYWPDLKLVLQWGQGCEGLHLKKVGAGNNTKSSLWMIKIINTLSQLLKINFYFFTQPCFSHHSRKGKIMGLPTYVIIRQSWGQQKEDSCLNPNGNVSNVYIQCSYCMIECRSLDFEQIPGKERKETAERGPNICDYKHLHERFIQHTNVKKKKLLSLSLLK